MHISTNHIFNLFFCQSWELFGSKGQFCTSAKNYLCRKVTDRPSVAQPTIYASNAVTISRFKQNFAINFLYQNCCIGTTCEMKKFGIPLPFTQNLWNVNFGTQKLSMIDQCQGLHHSLAISISSGNW